MQINFDNITVKTVRSDYSWDKYNPNIEVVEDASSDPFVFFCYAPYVNVKVDTSVDNYHPYAVITQRKIDFGDEYNTALNTQIAATSGEQSKYASFSHNYVMPGEYTITVSETQYIRTNNPCCSSSCPDDPNLRRPYDLYIETLLPTKRVPYAWMWYCFMDEEPDPRTEFFGSLQPGTECMTWDDCAFQGSKQVTWEEAQGPSFETRSKDVSWQWKYVVCEPSDNIAALNQKVHWSYTKDGGFLRRTWKHIKELGCDGINCWEMIPRLSAYEATKTYERKIKVIEIPPDAYLTIASATTGVDFTVRLSPKFTRCGSFPIEKIIWDLGDGTPIFEQSRWSINTDPKFVFNSTLTRDKVDPRNYDVVHTYNRDFVRGSCFYPSITAVTSSSFSTNKAAITIGPVSLEDIGVDIDIIQNQLTEQGKAYMGQIKDHVVFWNAEKSSFIIPDPPTILPKSYVQLTNQYNKFATRINTNEKLILSDSNA